MCVSVRAFVVSANHLVMINYHTKGLGLNLAECLSGAEITQTVEMLRK